MIDPRPSSVAPRSRRGHAALAAVVSLLCASGAVLAFVAAAFGPDVRDLAIPDRGVLRHAADDAVALALAGVWGPIEYESSGEGVPLEIARERLDALGITAAGGPVDLRTCAGLDGDARLGEVLVEGLTCVRTDRGRRTLLHLSVDVRPARATAAADATDAGDDDGRAASFVTEQVVEIDDAPWNERGFALVTGRVDAGRAPLVVDSAARAFNRDEARVGTFAAVAAAITGDHVAGAPVRIAGSLHVGGHVVDRTGREIADPSRAELAAWRVGPDGRIVERADERTPRGGFAPIERVVVPAYDVTAGAPEALYLEQAATSRWIGGFPEATTAFGGLGVERAPLGSLEGAASHVVVVPFGTQLDALTVDPSTANLGTAGGAGASPTLRLEGTIDGHLVAFGTTAAPLRIDGELIVEGDLVLAGIVRGAGRVVVRGTVWLPGDVLWKDGTDGQRHERILGGTDDGTANGLWIAAAGDAILGTPFAADGSLRTTLRDIATSGGGAAIEPRPTGDWIDTAALARGFERLLAERARWKPLEIDVGLFAAGTLVVSAPADGVGTSGRATVVGSLAAPRIVVDAPAGLRVLFDPRAPDGLDVRDAARARLRRLGAARTVTP